MMRVRCLGIEIRAACKTCGHIEDDIIPVFDFDEHNGQHYRLRHDDLGECQACDPGQPAHSVALTSKTGRLGFWFRVAGPPTPFTFIRTVSLSVVVSGSSGKRKRRSRPNTTHARMERCDPQWEEVLPIFALRLLTFPWRLRFGCKRGEDCFERVGLGR